MRHKLFARTATALLASAGLVLAACATVSSPTSASPGSTSQPDYPIGNFAQGLADYLVAPGAVAPGANIWTCKPSEQHPYPVVLVHGTFANMGFSWQELAPMLADEGYCVFELNYGQVSPFTGTSVYATGDIAASAQQLSDFVNQVLAATGASKVDIVGHSQGGMMPRYYIQNLGGASKVKVMVGLAASNEGTTADGLATLGLQIEKLTGGALSLSLLGCPACDEQMQGSSFVTALDSQPGGGTSPSVTYVNIESKYDEVVTPYTNAFLPPAPNVQNLTVQDYCSTDYTEHIGIIYDPVALNLVANALGADDPNYKPPCQVVLPVVS